MMELAVLKVQARERCLSILGGFHSNSDDKTPEGCKTLLLLGPDEPHFWSHLKTSPEGMDGASDPVDRWSKRVIDDWARHLNASAVYPFGGPPYAPFFSWALRSGRIEASPIQLLVHDVAGLFVSFRGALALPVHVDLSEPEPGPCMSCSDTPCKSACPVDAFARKSYDVETCKTYLQTRAGQDCMDNGCKARRACPVSQRFGRLPEQSAYHMRQFLGA